MGTPVPAQQPLASSAGHGALTGCTGMDGATAFDVSCYLPGDILAKVDRAAMAHGLETRSPFLDVDLAEFVLGLPWRLRFPAPSAMRSSVGSASADRLFLAGGEGITGPLKRTLRCAL